MNYSADFIRELKERSNATCECERGTCHDGPGRCTAALTGEPSATGWTPVMTGETITFPPVVMNYIALCRRCFIPRAAMPSGR